MKIFLKVKPKSKIEKIEKINETHFMIAIKEPPEKGKANKAVIKKIAKYFKIKQLQVVIISGLFSKNKVLEITQI
ncbi:MAG: DUF167 domain-containing protein [Patescibacteria group bacterium]